ncbi:RNA-directed DNA polymerase (Reverse transcriptase) [Pseudomonas veronii]|uniref:RNA-directed DNA polymerase (Reverse transcriptase) n=1 Tax=Pseudomonas veronii TaxID=76761 RepID=UPI0028FC2044|nr:RNA-directed DNA polymerase (Reverse transcriptase) [Pseudomonas veronii]
MQPEGCRLGQRRKAGTSALSVSDEVNCPQNKFYNAGQGLLEQTFARESLQRAWKRANANKGAADSRSTSIVDLAEGAVEHRHDVLSKVRIQIVK